MKPMIASLATAMALILASGAFAADPKGEALAKASGCLNCHALDKKIVGPAYKDVASKYKNNKNALAMLVKKVKLGGKGVWGDMLMPPNSQVKDADIKTIVQWVLSLK